MMTEQAIFVGREDVLSSIGTVAEQTGNRCVICISGDGGIGKTRLLQEVARRLQPESSPTTQLVSTKIVDFDDAAIQSPGTLRRYLTQMMPEKSFESYLQRMLNWRDLEMAGASPEQLREETEITHSVFVRCYNQVAAEHRIVLFFDTIEKVEDIEVGVYLRRLIPELDNTLVLIAGRNPAARKFFEGLPAEFQVNGRFINLPPLDPASSQLYLQKKLDALHNPLRDPALVSKVLLLARGRPIVIDLAVEWISRQIPVDWLSNSQVSDFDHPSEQQIQEFESRLVGPVTLIQSPMDVLTLALAHVYPLQERLVIELGITEPDAAPALFARAREYVFIKVLPDQSLTLHDEMRRMIEEYVWKKNDPTGELRSHYSAIAVQHYRQEVAGLEKQLQEIQRELSQPQLAKQARQENQLIQDDLIRRKDVATFEWLRHSLLHDINGESGGFELYRQLAEQARQEYRSRLAIKLERIIRSFAAGLNDEQAFQLDLDHGRMLRDLGGESIAEARQLFRRLLETNRGIDSRAAEIFNSLGATEVLLGNFDLGLEYEQESWTRYDALQQQEKIINIENYIGYIHRLKGEWDTALGHYEHAKDLSLEFGYDGGSTYASILNNMGYVLSLGGRYEEAEERCRSAIEKWTNLGRAKHALRGQITLATICRDKGNYDEAIALLLQVIHSLREPGDHQSLTRAHFHLGWTRWFEASESKDEGKLKEAAVNFLEAERLAEEYHFWIELPGILHQSSNVYWLLGQKDKARETNRRAFELSARIHDIKYAVDSLVGFAEFDADEKRFENILELARQLKVEYEDKGYKFPLFYGRMRRILAVAALENKQYETAVHYYAEGIALISSHGGYGMYFIRKELEDLEHKLGEVPPSTARDWIKYLKAYWQKHVVGEKRGSMIAWCDDRLSAINQLLRSSL